MKILLVLGSPKGNRSAPKDQAILCDAQQSWIAIAAWHYPTTLGAAPV
jgi:hypothetical protein